MRKEPVVVLCAFVAAGLSAREIQVSPDGLSPHAALEAIRAAKAKGDASGWTVKVAPGRYVLKSPLVFTPEDSGSPSAPVRWVAENGTAVFAGGDRLAGWRDEGDGVWSAPVPRDETGKPVWFQSLYVNGRRAVRARHPNAGYFQVDAVEQQTLTNGAGSVSHIQNVTVNDAAADALTGLSSGELAAVEFQVRVKWSYGAFSVTGWDPQTRRLKVCTYDRTVPDWGEWSSEKNLFCFENVRAGFDAPGEWFYDVIRQRICYRPMPGETLARLEAYAPSSGLPGIVRFEGDLEAGRFVTDIAFEGVSFELSTTEGHRLASDFVQQYQGQAARETGGCIYANGTRRIAFDACRVAHTENYAIRMDKGCVSNRIVRCELTDLGAGGLFIGDVKANYFPREPGTSNRFPKPGFVIPYGDPRTAKFHPCAFIAIDDCTISHAGRVNPEGCGVLMTQASDCAVTHCDIYDLYYTGVSVGWTWGYSGSLSQRNTVAFNRIYTIGQDVMSDMGGIYTLGTSFGTCISNNVIHDVRSSDYGGWGLYNDEGSEGVVWENNLVYDVTDAAYHQHYGRDNTVRNNIFVNARKAQLAVSNGEGHRSVTFDRNIVCWDGSSPLFAGPKWSVRVADGKDVVEPVEPARSLAAAKVDWGTNLFWCATGTSALDPLFGGIRADPLFVDLGKDDFRLREGSPARTMGFKPWDFALSGRRKVPDSQARADGAAIPRMALRLCAPHTATEEQWRKTYAAIAANPGCCDEVWFSTGTGVPPLDWHHAQAARIAAAADDLRKIGIVPSLQFQATLGHGDVFVTAEECAMKDWTGWTGSTGVEAKYCNCPRQPEFLDYVRACARIYAGMRPGFLWIDDDLRIDNHCPATDGSHAGCWCATCLADFGKLEGKAWTREALAAAVGKDPALAARWEAFSVASIAAVAQAIAEEFRRLSPETRMGYQHCTGDKAIPSVRAIATALARTSRWPVGLRPGGGDYYDLNPCDQVVKSFQAVRFRAKVADLDCVDVWCPEVECWPRAYSSRSAQSAIVESFVALAYGFNATSLFLMDTRYEEDSLYAHATLRPLASAAPVLSALAKASDGMHPAGFSAPATAEAALCRFALSGIPVLPGVGRDLGALTARDLSLDIFQTGSRDIQTLRDALDARAGGTPATLESPFVGLLVPRVASDGSLRTVALLNTRIGAQGPVALRLRGVPAGAAVVWHPLGGTPDALSVVRSGGVVRVEIPEIAAWNGGFLSVD